MLASMIGLAQPLPKTPCIICLDIFFQRSFPGETSSSDTSASIRCLPKDKHRLQSSMTRMAWGIFAHQHGFDDTLETKKTA